MTSETRRDPLSDHLLTPENSAFIIIDYQPGRFVFMERWESAEAQQQHHNHIHHFHANGDQKTWHRDDAMEWANVYAKIFPPNQLLIESYGKAQEVVTNNEQLDSARA